MFDEEVLTGQIIECAIAVHKALGPGFIEAVYHNALMLEFAERGIRAEREVEVLVRYKGKLVGKHRLDVVVEEQVVLELKTVEALSKAHYAQLRSYLKASNIGTGLLINFSEAKADYRRVEIEVNQN